MHTRWARNGLSAEEASTITLTRSQLEATSGKRRADVARTSAERLADVLSISVEHRGDVTVIHWPKWAEYQGLPSESRAIALREMPPPRTETETRPETETQEEPESLASGQSERPEPPAPRPRTKRKPQAEHTLAPEELAPEDRKRLLAWIERRGFGWFRSRLPDEVETCLAHFRSAGTPKADWYATAQNWIVRAIDGGGDFPPMPPERREEIAKRTRHQLAAKRIDAEIAAEQQPAAPARASPVESVSQVEPLEIPGLRVVTFGSAT